ncbi:hypothetical protein K8S19_07225 [bacterium]|nr:hypothetical protein [bacterium]
MSQTDAPHQDVLAETLHCVGEIIEHAEKLIALENQWKNEQPVLQTEKLNTYVEAKKELFAQMTTLFESGQWQHAIKTVMQNTAHPMNQKIVEQKLVMTKRFQEAMRLHDQALTGIKRHYAAAGTGLEDIQKTKQYLSTHRAMRHSNQRIDISQ